MSSPAGGIFSLNGQLVVPNDHVYLSPPWSARDSEPYLVCRIIEFLEPNGNSFSKVRVAYYLRQKDISSRSWNQERQVVATMHSDVCPVQFMRRKCWVKHRDELKSNELELWKKVDDHFWFYQLYDRYIHRAFDVVPTSRIKNAPLEVRKYLQQSYTYVFVETPRTFQLYLPSQTCCQCNVWAQTSESVRCVLCEQAFHFACLDPPMLRKPAAGYIWACTSCIKGAGDEIRDRTKGVKNLNKKGKVKSDDLEDVGDLRTTNGWPFRYFGEHCDPASVLSPHDSPYPRACTRFGPKFQAVVPEWTGEPQPITNLGKRQRGDDNDENVLFLRGGEETVTLLYSPTENNNSRLPNMSEITALPSHKHVGVALLNKAIQMIQGGSSGDHVVSHLKEFSAVNNDLSWPAADLKTFDDAVERYGDDLTKVASQLRETKPCWEVVRYWYVRHGHKYQGDVPSLLEEKRLGFADIDLSSTIGRIEEDSMCGSPPPDMARGKCLVCETKESDKWLRCPEHVGIKTGGKLGNRWMCEQCGLRWRFYGSVQAVGCVNTALEPVLQPKKTKSLRTRGKPAEVPKASSHRSRESIERQSAPPLPKPAAPKPCVICKRFEPKMVMHECAHCGMTIHSCCYGINSEKGWPGKCDLCQLNPPPNKTPHCVLCPAMEDQSKGILTVLDCLKLTEDSGFVHLVCALWHHRVMFRDPEMMRIAEGCMSVQNRDQTCTLCGISGRGATIPCDECGDHAHVGCAWVGGRHRFVYTMKPVKIVKKKKDGIEISFKGEKGALTPIMLCKSHNIKSKLGRPLYEIWTKDPLTKLTVLQTHSLHYKHADPNGVSFPLLRKSARVQELIQPALSAFLVPIRTEPLDAPLAKRQKSGPKAQLRNKSKAMVSRGKTRTSKPKPKTQSSAPKHNDEKRRIEEYTESIAESSTAHPQQYTPPSGVFFQPQILEPAPWNGYGKPYSYFPPDVSSYSIAPVSNNSRYRVPHTVPSLEHSECALPYEASARQSNTKWLTMPLNDHTDNIASIPPPRMESVPGVSAPYCGSQFSNVPYYVDASNHSSSYPPGQ